MSNKVIFHVKSSIFLLSDEKVLNLWIKCFYVEYLVENKCYSACSLCKKCTKRHFFKLIKYFFWFFLCNWRNFRTFVFRLQHLESYLSLLDEFFYYIGQGSLRRAKYGGVAKWQSNTRRALGGKSSPDIIKAFTRRCVWDSL